MRKLQLLVVLLLLFGGVAEASLYGPWRRYRNENLGIQMPTMDDWVITPLKDCVVFAMQLNPNPYVRLAIGRVPAAREGFNQSVDEQIHRLRLNSVTKTPCRLKGSPAVRVEGIGPAGHVMDYYVDRGNDRYWIGFVVDNDEHWREYSKSFDLILTNLQFI